jgi:ketosteroid isomerase-like protein
MSEASVEAVGGAIASAPASMEELFGLLHDEVEWDYVGAFPESRTYHGHAEVREFFATWTDAFDDFGVAAEELIDADDSVVVHIRQWGRGKDTGAPVENRTWQVLTFRDEKIIRCRGYAEKSEALEAAGLSE